MSVPAIQLRRLGPEPFGRRLRRAREEAGAELRAAAEAISRYTFVSYSTLSRLESLNELPNDRRRRNLVYLALLLYGVDPEDFGLTSDDLPKGLSPLQLAAELSDLRSTWNLCSETSPGHSAAA